MSRFISAKYASIEPYTPGEQPQGIIRLVKLNTNENPYPPSPKVAEAINKAEIEKLRLYSDPSCTSLVKAAAEFNGVKPENVYVGNGSDEVLAFCFLAFGGKEKKFRFPTLSYSFYPVFASLFEVNYEAVPLNPDFTLNVEDYIACGRNVVIANPNAPTGYKISTADVERILASNPDNVVIIDEAYVDFGGETVVPLINKYDNLIVTQTMSKSRSLAGMRVGLAFGSAPLIADLNAMKFSFNPYNLDRLAILAGTAAYEDKAYWQETCRKVTATRDRITEVLRGMGWEVMQSNTNFVFAKPASMPGTEMFNALRAKGVITRHWDDELIRDWIRISIGSDEDMDYMISIIREIEGK